MKKESEFSNVGKIRRLLNLIGISPVFLLVPIALSMVTAVFEGASLGLLVPILTGFLQKNFSFIIDAPYIGQVFQLLPGSILKNDKMLFGVLLGGLVLAFVLKNFLRYITKISIVYFFQRCVHHLRKTVFKRYLGFGKLFFDSTNIGHHNTLLMTFTNQALRPVQVIDKLMNSLFSLVAYFTIMLTISWRLTLFAGPLFLLLYYMIRSMIAAIKKISYAIADSGSAMGKKSIEILSTVPLVKAYRTERLEQQHFTHVSDKKAKLDLKERAMQEMIFPLQEIMTMLSAMIIFVGSLMLFGREQIASAPALVVYFYVVINASHKFGAISGFRSALAVASGPLDAVMEIFDPKGKHVVPDGTKECKGLCDRIECKNLSFSYNTDRSILDNVSFLVNKGQMVAIVGPTGAGKSTIINILMRFYDCKPGSIFLDGEDIRSFTLDSYLSHIALVSQETLLLNDSLRNNIAYGLGEVDEAALLDAVSKARLSDFVSRLPEGLNTLIGDRGVRLSGGEKQRVSIARALLKGAEILILDEATSSLDTQTEKLIQEAIDDAVSGHTAIVIAHRLSTIKNADAILVLEEKGIVEHGTLDELLEKKGIFYGLWQEQKF